MKEERESGKLGGKRRRRSGSYTFSVNEDSLATGAKRLKEEEGPKYGREKEPRNFSTWESYA